MGRPTGPVLDLREPVRLDAWAITLSAGIVAGTVVPALVPAGVAAALIVSAGALAWRDLVPAQWRLMAVLAPLFAGVGAGISFLHSAAPDPLAELAVLEPGEVVIVGTVGSPPAASSWGYRADVRVEHLWYGGREVLRGGRVEVFAGDLSVGVGDRVRVDGDISRPETGEDGFDYAKYLATKNVSAVVEATSVWPVDGDMGWIGRVHRRTDVALGYGLHPREAAVVRGMVLGDRSLIPEELEEDFQRSGITHVLAISGQHVAVLAAVVYFALRAFAVPAAARTLTTLALIWLYILVAGAPPSAIRAGVVASFVLAAGLLGRQISPLHFMMTMLACVLAYNPLLVYNAGFQLSVAAVFGILLLKKPLKSLVEQTLLRPFNRPPQALSNLLSVSLAAQVATAPIVAASFDEVSVVGALTNLVAVPLSGPILTLGLLGSVIGNVAPALAYPLNASNGFLVTLLVWIAQVASAFPFAAVTTPGVTLLLVALFYAGCVPAALSGNALSEKQAPLWAAVLVLWSILWLVLVGAGGL
ncbi:MAG TPA: ComEC/Rec2 family competence protein [Rubrobacteraceae bacterium]|nr:ComEC/Rec2 family competence protein [Rubrobacteraceae bacterium]